MTWPAWRTSPPPTGCGCTSTPPTEGRRCWLRRCGIGFAGIERADSLVVDPHKWLFAPFDCAALIYRLPQLARAVHTQDAGYLDVLHTEAPDEWNPSDYAFHLTRRARGLALWFSLAVNGTDAYGDAVEAALQLARDTAARIERTARSGAHTSAGAVCRAIPPAGLELRRTTGRWSTRLLSDQIGFVTPTKWQGETVARLAFLHPHTTMEIVDEVLATMLSARPKPG